MIKLNQLITYIPILSLNSVATYESQIKKTEK